MLLPLAAIKFISQPLRLMLAVVAIHQDAHALGKLLDQGGSYSVADLLQGRLKPSAVRHCFFAKLQYIDFKQLKNR